MPQFKHDCERCEFLASINLPSWELNKMSEQTFDLYHCPGTLGGSVIARFGDDGPEYASGDVGTVARNIGVYRGPKVPRFSVALEVAVALAENEGLIQKQVSYKSL